jgi:G:T-mismatch repair DNA endonuclease (very short patch repair protein)
MPRDISKMDSNWQQKFIKSGFYDLNIMLKLSNLGWEALILWECEINMSVYGQAERIVRARYLNSLRLDSLL